eukprot:CAMPEP_0114597200 /NCGR_PEP_ID=MMETSP0125-20121206/19435_1 /TAXON_ID=485358 ORGANISM="Aristerostoma sp., Strain ATCC 50986" /NCGR_SAMPLE_ID=MMETSP0125 /ASSEMBLY_ACC=CAM_ASM_000245 /LENGTH=101 /DNA_ID=CAMNT_0001801423 /DNA_START=464 /DNA_END=769 /DNA_ORIENTATION=+
MDYPALDQPQILNQTGITRVTIVEKDNKSIIHSGMTTSAKKDNNSMVTPDVPSNSFDQNKGNTSIDGGYYTETKCFCIPVKKKKHASTNPDLSKSLLSNNQ